MALFLPAAQKSRGLVELPLSKKHSVAIVT